MPEAIFKLKLEPTAYTIEGLEVDKLISKDFIKKLSKEKLLKNPDGVKVALFFPEKKAIIQIYHNTKSEHDEKKAIVYCEDPELLKVIKKMFEGTKWNTK